MKAVFVGGFYLTRCGIYNIMDNGGYMIRDIKALRTKYDYTQEGLARLLDVSVETVRKWEQGINKPGRRSKRDIREAFPSEKDIDLLFKGQNNDN